MDDHTAVNVEAVDLRGPGALGPRAVLVVLVGQRGAVLVEAQEGPAEEGGLDACFDGGDIGRLVRALLSGPVLEDVSAAQPAGRAFGDAAGDRGDLLARGSGSVVEDDAIVRAGEDAVERDHVEVYEASEGGVEPLDERDGAGLAARRAERLRLVFLPAPDLFHEDPVARGQRFGP